jgi:ABC-type amino acid transport substrate-binding protein
MKKLLISTLLATFAVASHAADAPNTLAKIKSSKSITLAYAQNATPFSFDDTKAFKPAGYSISLCEGIVAQIQRQLGLDTLKINWVAGTTPERLALVAEGKADMECGVTTNTLKRQEKVDFSITTFVQTGALLVRADSGVKKAADLAGKKLSVVAGTTTQRRVTEALANAKIAAEVLPFKDREDAFKAMEDGKVQALAGDLRRADRELPPGEYRGAGIGLPGEDRLPGRRPGEGRPDPLPDRSQALPGSAGGGQGGAGAAGGASADRASEPGAGEAPGRPERFEPEGPGRCGGSGTGGSGFGRGGQGAGHRGRTQPGLHHHPLAGDRGRRPRPAARGRLSQRPGRERPAHLRGGAGPDLGQLQRFPEPDGENPGHAGKGQVIFPKSQDFDVELVLPSGQPYGRKGKINFADPSFSQDTGSFMVRASLPNPRGELRPGMFATAIMKGAVRPDAIVIPQLAVQQGSNGHLVYVIKQDGTAEVRPVVVGDYEGDKDIVIVNGLRAGDRVVVDGVLKVAPGKPVKIVEPGSAPDQPAAKPAAAAQK